MAPRTAGQAARTSRRRPGSMLRSTLWQAGAAAGGGPASAKLVHQVQRENATRRRGQPHLQRVVAAAVVVAHAGLIVLRQLPSVLLAAGAALCGRVAE